MNTLRYGRKDIERVAHVAYQAAMRRRKQLLSVDKANVLETSQLWRQVVSDLADQYPEVSVEHIYVDYAAMRLVSDPATIDVLLTENMFGDILSDEAAVLAGSLGLLPSALAGRRPWVVRADPRVGPAAGGQGCCQSDRHHCECGDAASLQHGGSKSPRCYRRCNCPCTR